METELPASANAPRRSRDPGRAEALRHSGWIRWTLGGLALVVVAGILISIVASVWWRRTTDHLAEQLSAADRDTSRGVVHFSALDTIESLPSPVRRYLRIALRDGQPLIRTARLKWTGTFLMREPEDENDEGGWSPFEAAQVFATEPPAFVWDARMQMAPLVSVNVRDGYVNGRGSMRGAALAIVNVVNEHDRPELDAGALQRYLAESIWLPTALLPSDRLTWTSMDDRHARATLTDGITSVSLEFEFAASGEIIGIFTPGRYRSRSAGYELTPWGASVREYVERSGMRIPLAAEAYWKLGGRTLPYWRGELVHADFEYFR